MPTSKPPADRAALLQILTELLHEVMEGGGPLGVAITESTSFNEDLELESIEFVALAEKLQLHFGADIDFVGWLSQKSLDDIIALRVGDLVDFLAAPPPANP